MARRAFAATAGPERFGVLGSIGLVALPLAVGGLLTWSLSTPTEDLDRVTAAIVNDDVPVSLNGQTVPVGRQFAAGLIAGSPDAGAGSDFDWVLTNDDDAASGLADGTYVAVVTIPPTFSASATSFSGPASDAVQAELDVETAPTSALLDPALSTAITSAAVSALNAQLISQYLGQVYAGFNTINEQIGQASDGASQLADGASSVADGASQLATGAGQLAAGLDQLDAGADALASGLAELDAGVQSLPGQTAQLAQGSAQIASATDAAASAISGATDEFARVVDTVCETIGPLCDRARAALARLQQADSDVGALAAGADAVASGNQQLADAMPGLVGGVDASASGAAEVASGASSADDGAATLDTGAQNLAAGAAQVDAGAAQLADGLAQAVEQIPTYTDDDIAILTSVVSQPVRADRVTPAPGMQSVPFFAVIALWIGAIALALARSAVPTRPLLTAESSGSILLRTALPGVALGAAQGLVVGIAVLFAVQTDPFGWVKFIGACAFIGIVFALVDQGLAAAFGGPGRFLAVLVAVLALAVGLSSTVPPFVESLAGVLPTTPALGLLLAALANGDGWADLVGLLCWAALGIGLMFAGIAARRRVRVAEAAA